MPTDRTAVIVIAIGVGLPTLVILLGCLTPLGTWLVR